MNRIDRKFEELKAEGKKAFIPFITAGDPDLKTTISLVLSLESAGADIIELGVPFSDPIADGPSIQRSSLRALKSGTSLKDIIKIVMDIRSKTQIPIVLMSYYNPIFRYGVKRFAKSAVESGVDGVIVADLPPEEAGELISSAREDELATVFLIAPTSTAERIKLISQVCTGFVYCVSLTGVTGARDHISDMLIPTLNRIKEHTDKPVAVGFGVSNPDQAKRVAGISDGVIVGSAIVNIIEANFVAQGFAPGTDNTDRLLASVKEFAGSLSKAIKSA